MRGFVKGVRDVPERWDDQRGRLSEPWLEAEGSSTLHVFPFLPAYLTYLTYLPGDLDIFDMAPRRCFGKAMALIDRYLP
jgi:hypothetical protein